MGWLPHDAACHLRGGGERHDDAVCQLERRDPSTPRGLCMPVLSNVTLQEGGQGGPHGLRDADQAEWQPERAAGVGEELWRACDEPDVHFVLTRFSSRNHLDIKAGTTSPTLHGLD